MNPQTMVKEIIKDIKEMPPKDLRIVEQFVEYLREKELEEEILTNGSLVREVKSSQKSWKRGKTEEFINWEDFKKKNKI